MLRLFKDFTLFFKTATMRKSIYWWILLKNYKTLLGITYLQIVLACLACYLLQHWTCSANDYSDNVIIELFVGLIVAVIPLLLGMYVGRKINSDIYHVKFKELFERIAQLREHTLARLKENNLDSLKRGKGC